MIVYHVCTPSAVAAETYNTSPALSATVLPPASVTVLLEVRPLMQVALVAAIAHALFEFVEEFGVPRAALRIAAVLPPFGRSLVSWIELAPV